MSESEVYKKMYYHLFNAVTDALDLMEHVNFGLAIGLLKKAQQDTEEMFIDAADPPETPT